VRAEFGAEAGSLYELIWKRTVASQMKDAVGRRVTARIGIDDAVFRATGRTLTFAGFQRAYVEGSDDPEGDLAEQDRTLPPLEAGQAVACRGLEAKGHETQPPARYTEASLVKELDTRGIGRPSTWAGIISVLLHREYAFRKGPVLVPTWTAFVVVRMLKSCFGEVLEYEFTARMEDELDAISRGEYDSREYLRRFYLGNGRAGLQSLVESGLDKVDPRKACAIPLGSHEGKKIEVRVGKYGLFLSDGKHRAPLPEDTVPDELTVKRAHELLEHAARGPTPVGKDPSGLSVYVKSGRFGPYVQLGEVVDGGPKPKMVSLLEGMDPAKVDLATALRLLTLPRDLGAHPEDAESKPVQALLGRYGPYVKWGEESRSIPAGVSVLDITLDQAVALLKLPRTRRGRAPAAAPLRELGPHPVTGKTLKVMSGRYGPYVSDGTLNASLPKDLEPAALAMDEAVALLERRAERVKAGGGRPRGRRGARRAAAPSEAAPAPEASAEPAPKKKAAPRPKGARAKPGPRKPVP
jgi:DNA topoisomerase-1